MSLVWICVTVFVATVVSRAVEDVVKVWLQKRREKEQKRIIEEAVIEAFQQSRRRNFGE